MKRVPPKPGLLDLSPSALEAVLKDLGEPSYRAEQIRRWVFRKLVLDYGAMTNLPRGLADRLAGVAPSDPWTVAGSATSTEDGTVKLLLRASDRVTVETVAIPAGTRLTLCLSTQAGCALRCRPCATGAAGFSRNLLASEILAQVVHGGRAGGRKPSNVVLMGMGEPLLNYDNVMTALEAMADGEGFGLGARRITLSTVGVVEGMRRLAGAPVRPNLAVSLYAATQAKRQRLVPSAKRWPLGRILAAADRYAEATGAPVTYEYTMVDGFNASRNDADALGRLLEDRPAKVNLIPLNPVAGSQLAPPPLSKVRAFRAQVRTWGVEATVRTERGGDIGAACGQLRGVLAKRGGAGKRR